MCGCAASCTRGTWSPLGVRLAEEGQTGSVGGSDGGKRPGVVGLTRGCRGRGAWDSAGLGKETGLGGLEASVRPGSAC